MYGISAVAAYLSRIWPGRSCVLWPAERVRSRPSCASLRVAPTRGAAGEGGGFFYEPTIVANVDNNAEIATKEVFGPVVTISRFSDEEEAIQTVEYYRSERDTECYYEEKEGKWLVYRKGDNKTIKSINYSPADLKAILKG